MNDFTDFISEYGLVDLASAGVLYTWSNGRASQS